LKPHAGVGSHHHLHTSGAGLAEGEHLPIRIEFIEKKETVDRLLSELYKDLSVSSTPKRCVTERPKRSIRQNQKVREVAPSGVKKQLIPQAGCS